MPTHELCQSNQSCPNGWHQVTAPGGYESWYFDADDPATDTQIVACLMEGSIFDPLYLRRYTKYRKHPTKNPPPIPQDFVCASLHVYRNGKIVQQFMDHYPANQFHAARDHVEVTIGPNRFLGESILTLELHGTPWIPTVIGPKRLTGKTLSVHLSFTLRLVNSTDGPGFFSREVAGTSHNWGIANQLCEVSGSIEVTGTSPIKFSGRGYHDHTYGTGPIGLGLKRWFRGRVLLDDYSVAFNFTQAINRNIPNTYQLIETDSLSTNQLELHNSEIDWSRRSCWLLAYPDRLKFGDFAELSKPMLIASSPFFMRLIYDATVRGRKTIAMAEVVYPSRLQWPILGWMIERSIHRLA